MEKHIRLMKKRVSLHLFLVLGIVFLFGAGVFAIPQTFNVQGKLTDSNGDVSAGDYIMNYSIYDAASGGNILWSSGNETVSVDSDGIYNLILTSIDLNFSEQYYLGVKVESDNEMTPRINLTSSAYTFRSNVTDFLDSIRNYTLDSLFATGYVGIGTTNPSSMLEVAKSAGVNEVNLSGVMYVNSTSGNVGIGTTTPNTELRVMGTVKASNLSVDSITIDGQVISVDHIAGLYIQSSTGNVALYDDSNDYTLSIWNGSTTSVIIRSNGASQFNGGDIGIGTDNPQGKLNVIGDVNATGTINSSTDICIEGGNCLSSSGGSVGGSGVANRAAFWTDGNTLSYDSNFTWDNSNKRLGIGTDNPQQKLHVSDGGILLDNAQDIWFKDSVGTAQRILRFDEYDDVHLGDVSGGSDDLIFWSGGERVMNIINGNVGVGMNNPGEKLEVNGSINVTSGNDICIEGGNCLSSVSGGSNPFDQSLNTTDDVVFNTMNTSTIFEMGGYIGIGTTSPGGDLEVNSSAPNIIFTESDAAPHEKKWELLSSTGDLMLRTLDDGGALGDYAIKFIRGTENAHADTEFYTDGILRMILKSGGSVGIGTVSPSQKFEVNGTAGAFNVNPDNTGGPLLNTTSGNVTISSAGGSVIVRLG